MITVLYELLTGKPWLTVRSATAEFGPPPGARWEAELSQSSDAELYARGRQLVARLEAQRRQAVSR